MWKTHLVKMTAHLHINIQKSSLCHFKHQAHLCPQVCSFIETLLSVRVYANKVAGRCGTAQRHQNEKFSNRQHRCFPCGSNVKFFINVFFQPIQNVKL